jgi:3D (Asp-Asp-Asp) domain-containing protein
MKYEEVQILAEISKIEYEEVVLDKRLSPFNIDEKVLLLAIEENERENQEIEKNEEVKILKEENNDLEVKNTRLKKENTAKTDNVENQSVKKAKAVEVAKVQVTQDEPTKPVIKVDNTELPISTTSIGEMNIAPFTQNKNNSGGVNYDNMSVTINPNIVPYGTILWIDGLGFRYNYPSDKSSSDNNLYVYFKSESEASNWNNKKSQVYIVHNNGSFDFSKNSVIKTKSLDTYKFTAYCPCSICCGQYAGPYECKKGSIGAYIYAGVTIAADPKIVPYGSVVYIEGIGIRFVADCGGAIKNKRIDIYMVDHQSALNFGVANAKLHLIQQ